MFERIIAIILSALSVLFAPLTQTWDATELKIQLAQGFYESPYIVRPLEDITINDISIDEYRIVKADGGALFDNAVMTLGNEINKATGKTLALTKKDVDKAFVISENLHDTDLFTLKVENGKVIITGSANVGISRGIAAFADEVLLTASGTFDLTDGYEYTKTFSDYVTYEQFGAVGDGEADDLAAIVATHEYANANGLKVFAKETATYYIGGADKTAVIMTDTDWSTAQFIIDDTDVERIGAWVFHVAPSKGAYSVTGKTAASLTTDATNIGTTLDGESLVVLTDSNVKRYIRKGANQNSGSNQSDVILVDAEGNISADTPLIWDFNAITGATVYPVDTQVLTIRGGRFTTIANEAPSEYTYYARGIQVRRSNTVIDGIYHNVTNEGKTGAPYSAFVSLSCCANVTVQNSTFTGHKKYATIGSAGTSVQMGLKH